MGFGLSITDNTLQEPDKKDWVEHNGIMMSKRSRAAYRRAETIRSTIKEKKKTDSEKYTTIEKEKQRIIVAELLSKASKEWKESNKDVPDYFIGGFAIILESPELLFIKKLFPDWFGIKQDINYEIPNNIFIPNNVEFEKFNTTDRTYFARSHNLCNSRYDVNYRVGVLPKSYLEFINEYHGEAPPDMKFNCCLIWGDYCGPFSKYKEDIEKTFEYKLLGNNSYYVVTFCTRDSTKKSNSTINCFVEVQDFVSECANKYGYTVELMTKETGLYKHHMYTCFFHVYYDFIKVHGKQLNSLLNKIKNFDNLKIEIEKELADIESLKHARRNEELWKQSGNIKTRKEFCI